MARNMAVSHGSPAGKGISGGTTSNAIAARRPTTPASVSSFRRPGTINGRPRLRAASWSCCKVASHRAQCTHSCTWRRPSS